MRDSILRELGFRIAARHSGRLAMPPDIDEIGRNRQIVDKVRRVGHAKADLMFPAEIDDGRNDPAFMPELEGVPHGIAVQQPEK